MEKQIAEAPLPETELVIDHAQQGPLPAQHSQLRNGCYFQFSNAMCFEVFLGPPLVVFAQHLGASAIAVGLLAGMTPFMSPLQLIAARPAARAGFSRWVQMGWRTRNLLILLVALLALAAPPKGEWSWPIIVLLIISAAYCSWLQVITAGWLPWINSALRESTRGWYVVREQASILLGGSVTIIVSALFLQFLPLHLGFFAVFTWSFAGALLAWWFMRKVPEPVAPVEEAGEPVSLSWRGVGSHRPFRSLVLCNLAWIIAQGALAIHGLLFLRDRMGVSESGCLAAVLSIYIGGLIILFAMRHIVDRIHGKWLITAAWAGVFSGTAGWLALALLDRPVPMAVFSALFLLHGMSIALFSFAYMRELMAVVAGPGSERFFAVHSVLSNLSMWVAPVAWGMLIEWKNDSPPGEPAGPEGFRLFYAGVLVCLTFVPLLFRKAVFRKPPALATEPAI